MIIVYESEIYKYMYIKHTFLIYNSPTLSHLETWVWKASETKFYFTYKTLLKKPHHYGAYQAPSPFQLNKQEEGFSLNK